MQNKAYIAQYILDSIFMVASRLFFLIGVLLKCFIGTRNSVKERLPIVLLTQGNYPKVSNKYCLYLIVNAVTISINIKCSDVIYLSQIMVQ